VESASLSSLLSLLHDDPEQAGIAYRQLHQRLERFFHLNNTEDPTRLADAAMDRLAKRAAEADSATNTDKDRKITSPYSFALGIARHLLQEDARRRFRQDEAEREWSNASSAPDLNEQQRHEALEDCLSRVPLERRQLLESYYGWKDNRKAEHHRHVAERLGLNLNALRNRVLRARTELETCMERKLNDVSPSPDTYRGRPKFKGTHD
jgi:DNA-directed RNA polymerase specialized sigma24 family protein